MPNREDDDQKQFDEQIAGEQKIGTRARLDEAPPIGFLPNGEINLVTKGSKKVEPTVLEEEEPDDDLSDLDDLDALASSGE